MGSRILCVGATAFALFLSACGTASVQYNYPSAAPVSSASKDSNFELETASILAEASQGGETLTLPISRLVVVESAAQTGTLGGKVAAADDAGATPPPPGKVDGGAAKAAVAPGHLPAGAAPAAAVLGAQSPQQAASQAAAGQDKTASSAPQPATTITTILTSADGKTTYAINVIQVESDLSFSVKPSNDFFSNNDFSVAKLANTRIATSVSNTFTDETASRVKTIAGIVTSVAAFAAAAAPDHDALAGAKAPIQCLTDDYVIDDPSFEGTASADGRATPPNLAAWTDRKTAWSAAGKCLQIEIKANPLQPNLIPIAALDKAFSAKGGDWTRVWPVPACMTVQITVMPAGKTADDLSAATGQMTLIDPDYVELLPVPKKGKIAMHPVCGADLTDSATDKYQDAFDTISAIAAALPAKKAKTGGS